mgnify:CR=1 FL=1
MGIGTPKKKNFQKVFFRRTLLIATLMILISGSLVWRLVHFQVIDSERYVAHGMNQRIKKFSIPAKRGAILDRNGVDLALSVTRKSLVADATLVEDPVKTARALGALLTVDVDLLEERLNSQKHFVYLARQVESRFVEAALQLKLGGVYAIEEQSRVRPDGNSVLAVIGRTDIDGKGISGLEKTYDNLLSGSDGEMVIELGARGATIPGGEYRLSPASEGNSIISTLDRSLQFEAQNILMDGIEAAGAQSGVLVAMLPKTGEILTSVGVQRNEEGIVEQLSEHRAATWTFEPGSIIKPLTFSAVLDQEVGLPDSRLLVSDEIFVHDYNFSDWFEHDTEDWALSEILYKSSNVGTILWAQEIGPALLHNQFSKFGLGEKSKLDFPGEANGILHPVESWSGTSLPTMAIGQGISVTPMQMLTAYATLANRGLKPIPTLVQGVGNEVEVLDNFLNTPSERVVKAKTAESLVEIIEKVVETGTGGKARVPGYRVAGKTGTAWKPHEVGGYGEEKSDRKYVVSFAGFLPADDPELVVLVVVDEPSSWADSGGSAAAPIFADFASFAVRQLRIPSETERIKVQNNERVIASTPAQASIIFNLKQAEFLPDESEELASSNIE